MKEKEAKCPEHQLALQLLSRPSSGSCDRHHLAVTRKWQSDARANQMPGSGDAENCRRVPPSGDTAWAPRTPKKISRSENSRWGRPVDQLFWLPLSSDRPFCVSLPNQVLLSGDDVVIDEQRQQRPTTFTPRHKQPHCNWKRGCSQLNGKRFILSDCGRKKRSHRISSPPSTVSVSPRDSGPVFSISLPVI